MLLQYYMKNLHSLILFKRTFTTNTEFTLQQHSKIIIIIIMHGVEQSQGERTDALTCPLI